MKKKKNYILCGALVLTLVVLVLRMFWFEPAFLRVNEYSITLEKLPPEHDGLVLAVIGDLHIKQQCFDSGLYDAAASAIRERRPDLVLLLGDYVSVKDRNSLLVVDQMSQAVSKWHGKYGTLAIGGNHDYTREKAGNWLYVKKALEKGGIRVLDGEGLSLDIHGKPFQVMGIGDRENAWNRMHRIPETFDRNLPVYGLLHDPEDLYSVRNVYDMIFSAHTHRGQLRMPVFGERYLVLRFRGGWFGSGIRKHRNCTQFVTSGIGTSAWPVRHYNMPEVVFVTLRSPAVSR